MAKRIISLKMEEELIEKLDEFAKNNHRKRGPEINVAVEFYLKHQGIDLSDPKQNNSIEDVSNQCIEGTTNFIANEFDFK